MMMLYQKNTVNGVGKGNCLQAIPFFDAKNQRKEGGKTDDSHTRVSQSPSGKYPNGTRVRLKKMEDDPRPVPVGTEGTVTGVDDTGSICVQWDNGSSLHVLYQIDEAEIIE